MMLTASAKPGPRVTPIGAVLVSTAATCEIDRRDAIDRARQMDILEGLHPGGAHQIGAGISGALDTQCQKVAIRV